MEDFILKLKEAQSKSVNSAKSSAISNRAMERVRDYQSESINSVMSAYNTETSSGGLTQQQIEGLI